MSDFTPIPEPGTPVYPEQVKMIMTGEFAAGGPGSPENVQAEALVRRTQWLKQKTAELEAAIPGSGEWQAILDEIRAELARLQGIEMGALSWQVDHLERIITSIMLTLDAEGKYPDADAVMVETFDIPDQIDQTRVKVTNAFSGDDSVDVEDLSGVVVGANYVLSDGVKQEAVRVKSVATSGAQKRVITENPVTQEYDLSKTFLYRSSVTIMNGEAFAGGQSSETAWEPGETWTGATVAGGGIEDSAVLNSSTAAGFEFSSGVRWTESCVRLSSIFGVMHTGSALEWIDENGNILALSPSDFSNHPSFTFESVQVGTNYFHRIPVAYWKRGLGPSGSDADGKWCMWLSDAPAPGFAANPGAFKRNGVWIDRFFIGTHRAFNSSNKAGSQPGQTAWAGLGFESARTASISVGSEYHMCSLFEWHEIVGRMAIEKKTFDVVPDRGNQSLCKWRGIEDFAYGGGGVLAEWMDGVRVGNSGKYELWEEAGGAYVATDKAPPFAYSGYTYYIAELISGGLFDFLFLGSALSPSASFIPDLSGQYNTGIQVNTKCSAGFHPSYGWSGAFSSCFWAPFYDSPSHFPGIVGFRLCKW